VYPCLVISAADSSSTPQGGASCGHAWSADEGNSWTVSAFNACNRTVQLVNGSTVTLRQRERPHLGFNQDGHPVVLTNGAGWVDDCDAVFTFAQGVRVPK